jgi:hypothetical protein
VNSEVKKAIRAFNERLRYARNKYGEKSAIVEAMITEAKQVVNLTWTKNNKGISTGKTNENALKKPFEREEFSKFIMNNSATNLLNKTIYTSEKYKEDIKKAEKLKGKARAAEEERIFAEMTFITNMYTKIFGEIASDSSYEVAKECYEKYKNGAYDEEIKLYANDKITLSELIDIIYNDVPLSEILGTEQPKQPKKDKKSFYDFVNKKGKK